MCLWTACTAATMERWLLQCWLHSKAASPSAPRDRFCRIGVQDLDQTRVADPLEDWLAASPRDATAMTPQKPQPCDQALVPCIYICEVWAYYWSFFFIMGALWNRAGHYIFAFLWSPYVIGQTIILLPCDFFLLLLLLSFFVSSPNLSGRRLDVYHTSTHGVALVQI